MASEEALAPQADRIPAALQERPQWLIWRFEQKAGQEKPAKIPYYISGNRRTGKQGGDGDRRQLATYPRVVQACAQGEYDGIGFAFLPGDGLIGIDLDGVIDPVTGEIAPRASSIINAAGSYTEYSPSGKGVHIYVLGQTKTFKSNALGIEVFANSQFFTVTGRQFPGTPAEINPIPYQVLRKLELTVKGKRGRDRHPVAAEASDQRAKVESALAVLSADCGYETWIQIGMAVHAELGDAGLAAWDYWSSKGEKYPGVKIIEQHWRSFKSGEITGATLFKLARDAGWRGVDRKSTDGRSEFTGLRNNADTSAETQDDAEPLPPEYSEHQMALEFTAQQRGRLLYDAERGKWYRWDTIQWLPDLTLYAFDCARAVAKVAAVRALADQELSAAARPTIARAIASAKTIAAIERLTRSDRAHAVTASEWDSSAWLINTLGGVLDLLTGRIISRGPELRMTKLAPARPHGVCPLWDRFLKRVTAGDQGMIDFLQRWAGYCLTGSTREHRLLFLWGLGANGKSTFANVLAYVLGQYAMTAPSETFVESHTERHPTDLAMLQGARLVVVPEIEEGRHWATAKIKSLTGGDSVRARFMRQDFFEYTPQFKLTLLGNAKPSFRTVDEAIKRRFLLVPFTQTIPPEERDVHLTEKLQAERDGILMWALDGCLKWQEIGLLPPASVRDATDDYMADEDVMRQWVEDCCDQDRTAFAAVSELHRSYQGWATRSGEKFFGMKRFSQMLEDHGYRRARAGDNRVRGFHGLVIRQIQGRLEAVK